MQLVDEKNTILKKVMPDFNFDDPIIDPNELVREMHEVRKRDGGIGLAAPQIGVETRVIVIGMGDFQSDGVEEFAKEFFNPEITEYSKDTEYMIEGCLSFPGLFVKVKRPKEITFTYEDLDGTKYVDHLSGITSRIVQHEIDHLNGMRIMDRMIDTTIRVKKKPGRNELVTIKKNDAVKVLKYKKAEKFLNQDWILQ